MRTLILFETFGDMHDTSFPLWFLVEGDYTHLNDQLINVDENTDELHGLIYTDEGKFRNERLTLQQATDLLTTADWDGKVIQCGFAP